MDNKKVIKELNVDKEWVELISEARKTGITKEEIKKFIKVMDSVKVNERGMLYDKHKKN
ncbi:anti-repressor SinI family protein [Oceanobacillus sp. FSL H7-0719]|uniref:anti-repressor SinI family protein n=1 Tax=Oceanobacillus sp. FSL H7-0719 TaxID=2954507 RepID=UPI0032556A80